MLTILFLHFSQLGQMLLSKLPHPKSEAAATQSRIH